MAASKILGVCAWLSERFDMDVAAVRLLFIFATLIGFGSPIILYLILALVKPK